MKKILFISFILGAINATAQQGLYLKPFAGVGISGIRERSAFMPIAQADPITTYTGGINIGYAWHRWHFETGLQYLTTGKQMKDVYMLTLDPMELPEAIEIAYRVRYHHLILPLDAAYDITLSRRWHLQPGVGLGVSYNAAAYSKTATNGRDPQSTNVSYMIGESVNRFSLFGKAQANLVYAVNSRFSIFAGPAFQYMILSAARKPAGAPFNYYQRHYAATVNAGVIWQL